MSHQTEAQKQANQKEQMEGILALALLRWLNRIKKSDTDIKLFQDDLRKLLNTNYNKIINTVTSATLSQLNATLTADEQEVLSTILKGEATSTAAIQSDFITDTLQKWRNTTEFTEWKARVRQHLKVVVASTEVQGTYEGSKHEIALFLAKSGAFGKVSNKTWITKMDGREREAHGIANLQTVKLTADFLVGGENLQHPGDRNGTLANIIKCRCIMIFS